MTLAWKLQTQTILRFAKYLVLVGTIGACTTIPDAQVYEIANNFDITQQLELRIDRSKSEPTLSIRNRWDELHFKKFPTIKLDGKIGEMIAKDIFFDEVIPKDSECYASLVTFCRIPIGTKIKKRGYGAAFSTHTGFIMCIDSVVGRGPCWDMTPKTDN